MARILALIFVKIGHDARNRPTYPLITLEILDAATRTYQQNLPDW